MIKIPNSTTLPYTLILCRYNKISQYKKKDLKDRLHRIIPEIIDKSIEDNDCKPFYPIEDIRIHNEFETYEYKGKKHYSQAEWGLGYLYKSMCLIEDRDRHIAKIRKIVDIIEKDIPEVECNIILGEEDKYVWNDKGVMFSDIFDKK